MKSGYVEQFDLTEPVSEQDVAAYYDECEVDYRWFWHLDRCLAIHYGYWDAGVWTLRQALARMNEVLAERSAVRGGERVLDAGCGVGGSAIFLARRLGCRVTGLTLSEAQVQSARSNARRLGVGRLCSFRRMNYAETDFADGSFDRIWFLESLCQANDKSVVLREAFRLLRPGGRLVIADFFVRRMALENPSRRRQLSLWAGGWSLPGFLREETFEDGLRNVGFTDVRVSDETRRILPSARRLYQGFFPACLVTGVGEALGLRNRRQTNNVWTAYYQYRTLRAGLWRYGIADVVKP